MFGQKLIWYFLFRPKSLSWLNGNCIYMPSNQIWNSDWEGSTSGLQMCLKWFSDDNSDRRRLTSVQSFERILTRQKKCQSLNWSFIILANDAATATRPFIGMTDAQLLYSYSHKHARHSVQCADSTHFTQLPVSTFRKLYKIFLARFVAHHSHPSAGSNDWEKIRQINQIT